MIKLENVCKTFNKGLSTETTALQSASLKITAAEFVVVVGSNGSGKSTLLNCIAGNNIPDTGNIYIENNEVSQWPEYKRSVYISRIFQNPSLGTAPDLNILENFRLASLRTRSKGLRIGTNKAFENSVKEKISFLKMGLENSITKLMGSLSGGQRQALTLVMGIMDDCKIMLLDEPTAALDPRSSVLVMQKANEIIATHKLTALLETHNLKDALQYGSRLLMMKEGVITKDYSGVEKQNLKLEELAMLFD